MSLLLGPLGIQISTADLVLNGKPQTIVPQVAVEARGTDYESPAPLPSFTAYALACEPGAYVYVGNDATLAVRHNYTLTCEPGAYSYAGNAEALDYVPGAATVNYTLTCDTGSYAYSGLQAVLTYTSGQQASGGFERYKGHPWLSSPIRRYVDEIEPEVVEAVITAVALVSEGRNASQIASDTTAHVAAERALREFLREQKQAWKNEYAQLIRLEYERREQEFEDFQIAMLLFDM